MNHRVAFSSTLEGEQQYSILLLTKDLNKVVIVSGDLPLKVPKIYEAIIWASQNVMLICVEKVQTVSQITIMNQHGPNTSIYIYFKLGLLSD